ncbi:MAG: hypothetical protein Q9210_001885 [Variospora velana]
MYLSKQWLTILCLSTVRIVQSFPARPSNRLLPNLPSNANFSLFSKVNAGLGYGPIPPEFQARPDELPHYARHPLSESATFINTVHFMKVLGQGDFQEEIGPLGFRTPRYPSPVIALIVPPNHPTIKREYIIWGLQIAINHMYLTQVLPTFWTSHYTLLWNDEEIGGLSFGLSGSVDEQTSPTIDRNKRVDEITARNDPKTNSAIVARDTNGKASLTTDSADLTTDFADSRLSVAYTFTGGGLDKIDIFFTLLWVMAVASIPPSDTRILSNWIPPWLADLGFHTLFLASAVDRTTAPFLTFYWLLEAVAGAADYLVDQKRYGEFRMQLTVDGIAIGQGLFHHRPF